MKTKEFKNKTQRTHAEDDTTTNERIKGVTSCAEKRNQSVIDNIRPVTRRRH